MKKIFTVSAALSLLFLTSCANVYFAPQSVAKSKNHTKVAILPPKVTVVERKSTKENVNSEEVREQLAVTLQNDMYSWMQRRNSKKNVHQIELLDVDKTNQLLKGIKADASNEEICKRLGVDAIVISKFAFEKNYSDQLSIVLYFLTGGAYATNKSCQTNASIYYCSDSKNGWTYDFSMGGSGFTNNNTLAVSLIKSLTKKTPYTRKND
jgi:hypothetical protein